MIGIQITIACFLVLTVILSVIFRRIYQNNKQNNSCFDSIFEYIERFVLTLFANIVILYSVKDLGIKWYSFLLILFLYFVFVSFLKILIVCRHNFNCKGKNFESFALLFASPDYCITGFVKSIIQYREQRGSAIKRFNIINLLVSVFLVTFFMFLTKVGMKVDYLLLILVLRIVYRLFEIIISFAKDIINSEKKSNLKIDERIRLALLSLLEVLVLYFGYCRLINMDYSLPNALKALLFQDTCCNSYISILVALTGLVMVGTVIVQYISDKDQK